jgi:hypothetical protein
MVQPVSKAQTSFPKNRNRIILIQVYQTNEVMLLNRRRI